MVATNDDILKELQEIKRLLAQPYKNTGIDINQDVDLIKK